MNDELNYKKSGVDIDAANKAVDLIKDKVGSTYRKEVLTDIGGFGGLFDLNVEKYKDPVLVSSTDGVGTKLKLAFLSGVHHTVGQDLVAMCVNDIAVLGAEPLFFLDYLAVGQLEPEKVSQIVSGIARGCKEAGCALIGGETAEMPDFYQPGEYDMAGFVVGIVDKEKMIDGKNISPGDKLVGIASSGLHSNGYSLVRKVFLERAKLGIEDYIPELGCKLGEELLKPTCIYARTLIALGKKYSIKGMVHITGGGFLENIPRVLPPGTGAVIDKSWEIPPVFSLIKKIGRVENKEMYRTFNMGIGMVLIISPEDEAHLLADIQREGQKGWSLGEVTSEDADVKVEVEIV